MYRYEAISSIDHVSPVIIWSIYIISIITLLFFIKNEKISVISFLLILFSIQGIFEYIDLSKSYNVVLFFLMFFFVIFRNRNGKANRLFIASSLVTMLFIIVFVTHGAKGIAGYFGQLIAFLTPVFFFSILLVMDKVDYTSELRLGIKLLNIQIIASILKLLLIGFNEKFVGTISISGGSIPTIFATVYFLSIFIYKKGNLTNKDWIFIFLSFIVPIASGKRAVWFLTPLFILFSYFIYGKLKSAKYTVLLVLLLPLILYLGIRLNPSLNPENSMGGSFDYEFVKNYVIGYNIGSTKSQTLQFNDEIASGRVGGNYFYLNKIWNNLFNYEILFGVGNEKYNEAEARGSNLDFASKYQLTAWVEILVRFGFIVLLSFSFILFTIIKRVKHYSRKDYYLLLFGFFIYYFFYTNSIYKCPFVVSLYWLIAFVMMQSKRKESTTNRI